MELLEMSKSDKCQMKTIKLCLTHMLNKESNTINSILVLKNHVTTVKSK